MFRGELLIADASLRKKLEADPAHPEYLLTEPWVGYRFQNPSEAKPDPEDE